MRALLLTLLLCACPKTEEVLKTPVSSGLSTPTEVELEGLIWLAGPTEAMTWDEAHAYCHDRSMGLMEQNNLMLALLEHPELNQPEGAYWSSGISALDDDQAYVSFATGGKMGATLAPRAEQHLVRCVRVATRVE